MPTDLWTDTQHGCLTQEALCHPDTSDASPQHARHTLISWPTPASVTLSHRRVSIWTNTDTHLSQTTHPFCIAGLMQTCKSKNNVRKGQWERKTKWKRVTTARIYCKNSRLCHLTLSTIDHADSPQPDTVLFLQMSVPMVELISNGGSGHGTYCMVQIREPFILSALLSPPAAAEHSCLSPHLTAALKTPRIMELHE